MENESELDYESEQPGEEIGGDGAGPQSVALAMRVYPVVEDAVERGVLYGISRAYKYLDDGTHPTEQQLSESITREVMNSLCEVVDFEKSGMAGAPEDADDSDDGDYDVPGRAPRRAASSEGC